MERDRGFNFKLFVPPRVNSGQVSPVQPQGYSKSFDKFAQSMSFPNTSLVAPTKPTRQDLPKMKVVPPMEKDKMNCSPGQLYSQLFDEVEKIKCWKAQVDTDTMQKERRLQENKRTIETQRKAIQELQFANESLTIKLEEHISENEDLRNKNNATRNLCNILKDTFQRSAEKIHLFESEREETHHLFLRNSESIQKLIAAFESLRVRAEADQQEMEKVKEDFLHFEDLKEKEIAVLQTKLKDKENELQQILLDFHETQKQCKQLQDATDEQCELLKSTKTEQESFLQELRSAEQRCKETEKNCEAITAALEQSKKKYVEMIQSKDLNLEEISKVKNQQAEKLEQIQATVLDLQNSLALEIQRAKELEDKLMANNKELERRNTLLGETMEQSAKKDAQIKLLEDKLDKESKSTDSMKNKIDVTETKVKELTAELSMKTKETQLLKNEAEVAFAENGLLKMACEAAEKAQENLKEKSTVIEIKVQELEAQFLTESKKNREHTCQVEQLRKDITQHEEQYKELLSNFNELQSEKTAIQRQFEYGSSNMKAEMKVSEEKVVKLTREIQRLKEENQCLREETNSIKTRFQGEYLKTDTLQRKIEENCEHLQKNIAAKEKQIKAMETKNKLLKKQMAKDAAKSSQLENVINGLHEESQNLKRLNEEGHQKLLKNLESKSAFATELENEVHQLRLTAAEAIKNKEDTERKCQHKIADMVALMEKHKSQYDRMVEKKDAELEENKKKERDIAALRKSLELDLEKYKTHNEQLKQQLRTEVAEKENLQKELTDLKKEMLSVNVTQLSEVMNKQLPASNCKQGKCSEAPKESSSKRHVFYFSKTKKPPSCSKDDGFSAVMKKSESDTESIRTSGRTTPKTKEIYNEDLQTPRRITNSAGKRSKIKSYRIRTPPALAAHWAKHSIELDPKSDSSDQNDVLRFASASTPEFSAPLCKGSMRKIQSPVKNKSPGNSLKLAAVKRMRDSGWTAVIGCDKKKRKSNEKIFA
uniref:synaptonemal complex protein 1 isoform X2 n=1 Tax=Scatophagus argus TaxID=75038 RepID=UPI001ED7ED0A|nr:synaptonemal complex protein 1 isoform X2 [Scatophagus argus]